ncbi:MAG TPA: TonB-dependent receptor plug domain-containing protein, partial [Bacteroidales bacterium]|nr:TonB-dependent receptor plug domain-containing protein [Bacteroidales bacterium]
MRKVYAWLLCTLIFAGAAIAQEKTISGKVTSAADDSPLPFVAVAVMGTTKGVNSDLDGNYRIAAVKASDSLIFSFVGFEPQTVAVGNQLVINIKLKPTVQQLEAVEITALGVTRQSREVGYATQKVDGEDLLKSNTSNIISAVSGKTAGVQVSNSNGVDGGTTRIVIRGNNNFLTTNQPLIVVDGIPMENSEGIGARAGSDWGSAINNINPDDIEEMVILPGGSASALYGSRGANGVILITMKKRKTRQGIGVTYSVTNKITTPYRFREVQNKYGGGAPLTLTPPTFPVDSNGVYYYQTQQHTDNLILNQDGDIS